MSDLINNSQSRRELLKHMIRQLHEGHAPNQVRTQLIKLLGSVPYDDVVQVEQELIKEGLPTEEILRLCDVHTAALEGAIDLSSAKVAPPGHPVHTFQQENRALEWQLDKLAQLYGVVEALGDDTDASAAVLQVRGHFNALMDVDKHYRRKENLLFPFLEKHGINGPPTVMWGKHDETRALLKNAHAALVAVERFTGGEAKSLVELMLRSTSTAVAAMIGKEEQILLPMCLDTLTEGEWYDVYRQSDEIGYCLFDPTAKWRPVDVTMVDIRPPVAPDGTVQLPSGALDVAQLTALLNTLPVDLTFVDADDTVRYFSQGQERIFDRNRAILGRQVQFCHPPKSVHVVERILGDFKAGRQDRAAFWIEMHGRFIHIEYLALRDQAGRYLGCLEVSQDLTAKRALQGERRLLSYQGAAEVGRG